MKDPKEYITEYGILGISKCVMVDNLGKENLPCTPQIMTRDNRDDSLFHLYIRAFNSLPITPFFPQTHKHTH